MLVIDAHREHHYRARQARSQALATAHAVNLDSAIRHMDRGTAPDVVLVSHDDGTEAAVTEIRKRFPSVPVLLWVEVDDYRAALDVVRRLGLRGAVSYAMTPEEIEEEVLRATSRPQHKVTREIRARMTDIASRLEVRKH